MKVAVGSKNPIKIEAVLEAFIAVWPTTSWEIMGVEVDSGVTDQPMTNTESIRGARNRANAVMKQTESDYAVGLEGGIFKQGSAYFTCGWMVVINKKKQEGIGATVAIRLAPKTMDYILAGKELGDADDMLFGKTNSKQAEGHYGLMTNNIITRKQVYKDAVIVALTRFLHPELFE